MAKVDSITNLRYLSDLARTRSRNTQTYVPAFWAMVKVCQGTKFRLFELLSDILIDSGFVVYACQHLNPIEPKNNGLLSFLELNCACVRSTMIVCGKFELRFELSQSFLSSSERRFAASTSISFGSMELASGFFLLGKGSGAYYFYLTR